MTETIRALLIEDVPGDARLVRELVSEIEDPRIEIEHSLSLTDAARTLARTDYHVVLLDLGLPESSGVETVQRVRGLAPQPAIVVMSGLRDPELPLLTLSASAQECVLKDDLTPAHIRRAVQQAIQRRTRERELIRLAADAAASEAGLRQLLTDDVDGLLVVDDRAQILFSNPAAEKLLDCREREQFEPLAGADAPWFGTLEVELGERTVELRLAETNWRGTRARLVDARDISARKRSEAGLARANAWLRDARDGFARQACIDPLTNALNRRGIEQLLDAEQSRASREGTRLVAVMIDCDDFKRINQAHGYSGGDAVLVELVERLRRSLRPADHLARIGGDEFLVLLHETRAEESARVAERLLTSVRERPFQVGAGELWVTISIAVAAMPHGKASLNELLIATERELQLAKRSGKDRWVSHGELKSEPLDEAQRVDIRSTELTDARTGARAAFELAPGLPRIRGGSERNDASACRDWRGLAACLQRAGDAPWAGERLFVGVKASELPRIALERLKSLAAARICLVLEGRELDGLSATAMARARHMRGLGLELCVAGGLDAELRQLLQLEPCWLRFDSGEEQELERCVKVARALGAKTIAVVRAGRTSHARLAEIGIDLVCEAPSI